MKATGFSKMTKTERVQATMSLQETDRPPVYDILLNDALIEHFTGKYPPVGEAGLKLKCKTISRMFDMTRMAGFAPDEPGEETDEYGFVSRHGRWLHMGIHHRPFHDERGAVEWLRRYTDKLGVDINLQEVRKDFIEDFSKQRRYIGDDTVILHRESGTGLDDIRHRLGLELFSYIAADEPELISEYLERSTAREILIIHAIADVRLSPCALTYGDIGYNHGLMHSPAWLRSAFFPRIKELNDAWHEHGIKCLFHSDGNIMSVMDDLMDTGIDGLNPIETLSGMNVGELKRRYGDRIFLTGGIDMSQLLSNGTPEEVLKVCRTTLEEAPVGYFIGSTTEIDESSRLENVLMMLKAAGVLQ